MDQFIDLTGEDPATLQGSIAQEDSECQILSVSEPVPEVSTENLINEISEPLRNFLRPSVAPTECSDSEDSSDIQITSVQEGGAKPNKLTFSAGTTRRAFRNAIIDKTFIPNEETPDLSAVIEGIRTLLFQEIPPLLTEHHGLKGWVAIRNVYENIPTGIETHIAIETPNQIILSDFGLEAFFRTVEGFLLSRNAEVIRGHSNLSYSRTESILLKAVKWSPRPGKGSKQLPPHLADKSSLLNIENEDNQCFSYCLSAYLLKREAARFRLAHPVQNDADTVTQTAVDDSDLSIPDEIQYPPSDLTNPFLGNRLQSLTRPRQYRKHFARFGLDKFEFPISPKSVGEIESQLQLKINIFSYFDADGRAIYPMYLSDKTFRREIDLLYFQEHYVLITNLNAFLNDRPNSDRGLYFCRSCLGHKYTKEDLAKHRLFC